MASIFNDDYIRALLSAAPEPSLPPGRPEVTAAPTHGGHLASPAHDLSDGMTAESQKFFAAWKSWRGSQILPRRHQVQLTAIARLMPQLVVLEVHGPDRAVFRLAGTDIEQQSGSRLTGRSFAKLAQCYAGEAADQPQPPTVSPGELLWRQVSQPCGAVLRTYLEYRSGRREAVEVVAAPVLPDVDGAPVQVFAVLSRLSRIVPGPAAKQPDPVIRNFGGNLRFLDLGAGIPPQR